MITLSTAILADVFGIFLARRLAAPVIDLTETASRIAAGERKLQSAVGGPREVAHLAIAFNSMTDQLRQSLKDLEQRFADLKPTKEALRVSEERLRMALEGAADGFWDWNPHTGQAYFSPMAAWFIQEPTDRLVGFSPLSTPPSSVHFPAFALHKARPTPCSKHACPVSIK